MAAHQAEFQAVSDLEIGPDDYYDVWEKIKPLSSRWDKLSFSFRLKRETIESIKANHGSDCETCLQIALDHWLKKDYLYERHGHPSWRRVCVSVKEGGENTALAEEIASEHPLTATPPAGYEQALSPSSDSNSEKERADPSKPQIYVQSSRSATEGEVLEWNMKLREIKKIFADNVYKTKTSLSLKILPKVIDYMETHVIASLGSSSVDKQLVREEFHHIQTVPQLFVVLEKYVSWFNFDFIVKLVEVFLPKNQKLRRMWSAYSEKLRDLFTNCSGLAIQCVDAVQFGLTDVPGTQIMVAKVARDDYTLDDLSVFRSKIPEALKVPNTRFYFCSINTGCLELNYLIPDYLYSILFPLTKEQLRSLANIGVTELRCGELVQETTKEFPLSQEQLSVHSDIDICDPLWYENTSTPLHEACWRGLTDEVNWLVDKFGYETFHRGINGWSPILAASYGGHIDILQQLIEQYQCDPTQGDDDSVTSLHMASYKGHLDIVQYLLDTCHLEPDIADNSNNTALLYSALGGHCDLVTLFRDKKCDPSQLNIISSSLSLQACKSGQLALVHKLEELDLFSADVDKLGSSVLHYSAMSDSVELFQYLLTRYQIPIDVKDRLGRTPLHFASWFASSAVVEYIVSIRGKEALLETDNEGYSSLHRASDASLGLNAGTVYGKLCTKHDSVWLAVVTRTKVCKGFSFLKCQKRASLVSSLLTKASTCPNFNINATTATDQSLLHLACWSGSTLLVKALNSYSITASLDNDGWSPVHAAARSGSLTLLSYVVTQNNNLNVNEPDHTGRTPLAIACETGSINAVEYLINNHHSDSHVTDDNGMTSLHVSCRNGHIDLTQYLTEVQGSDIKQVDSGGRSVVHHAAWSGSLDLVQYLINEHGLSPAAVDNTGCTPLHYAARTLKLPLVKELIEIHGLDPHQADSTGNQPIHYAAAAGDIILLEYLVNSSNCNLSVTNNDGWNILHYSALKGHTHMIKHVINQYPHCIELLQAVDKENRLPLHLASKTVPDTSSSNKGGHVDVVLYLTSLPQYNILDRGGEEGTILSWEA